MISHLEIHQEAQFLTCELRKSGGNLREELKDVSVDGETFYDTGIRLPSLAEGGRRGLTTAEVEALPTQEEALN